MSKMCQTKQKVRMAKKILHYTTYYCYTKHKTVLEELQMKIGLVRHFKVDCPHKIMMTSKEFREWSEKYEHAGILKKKVNMSGIKWDVCYCSDLERAVETAKEVYSGNIYVDQLLREVDNAPFIDSENIRLPFPIWHICGRLAWFFKSKSQPEDIHGTRRRVRKFFRQIDWSKDNVLIVSHGFLIFNFIYELFRLGFMGKEVRRVKNGILYLYEIPDYKRPFQYRPKKNQEE